MERGQSLRDKSAEVARKAAEYEAMKAQSAMRGDEPVEKNEPIGELLNMIERSRNMNMHMKYMCELAGLLLYVLRKDEFDDKPVEDVAMTATPIENVRNQMDQAQARMNDLDWRLQEISRVLFGGEIHELYEDMRAPSKVKM